MCTWVFAGTLSIVTIVWTAQNPATRQVPAGTESPTGAGNGHRQNGEVFGDNSVVLSGDNSGTTPSPETKRAPPLAVSQHVAGHGSFVAERGRFELPLPLRADRFSKPAHSTTLPPLRVVSG